ncbi:MAG: hypothetical protein JWM68_1490 [Verrucomicrobiales bacterium]|nr:hypothetical protein [Verrucomicrobiales bacterium]
MNPLRLALACTLFLLGHSWTTHAAGPPLTAALQNNTIAFTWPTNAAFFALQYTTNLSATNWTSVSNSPSIVNGQFTVTNIALNASGFYRLKTCGIDASPVAAVTMVNDDYPAGIPVYFSTSPTQFPDTTCTVENSAVICTLPQSPLDASYETTFDASQSIDPRSCTNGSLDFHWQLFKPISQGGDLYSCLGITGNHSPILHVPPDSLPNLPDVVGDEFSTSWRFKLTLTRQPLDPYATAPQSSVAWFRLRYLGSRLTLAMSDTCQSQTNACPTCPCTTTNALPSLETP